MTQRRFPAVVPVVPEAVSWAVAQADDAGLPEARGLDVKLAVEEALLNVCIHAYGTGGGDLTLRTERTGEGFVVEIEDSGSPFDPLSVAAPDTSAPLESREVGGLGILLVRRVTDLVRWRREAGRNVLTLVFASPQPPEEEAEAGP